MKVNTVCSSRSGWGRSRHAITGVSGTREKWYMIDCQLVLIFWWRVWLESWSGVENEVKRFCLHSPLNPQTPAKWWILKSIYLNISRFDYPTRDLNYSFCFCCTSEHQHIWFQKSWLWSLSRYSMLLFFFLKFVCWLFIQLTTYILLSFEWSRWLVSFTSEYYHLHHDHAHFNLSWLVTASLKL